MDGTADRPERGDVSNSLSGSTVHGPVVQAREVHGGITFNYHQAPAPRPADRRPDQVPRPVGRFVNRRRDLAHLDGVLIEDDEATAHCPVGVVSGLPGVGKTATACQWAHHNQRRFPGGQLFIDFAALRGSGSGASGDRAGGAGADVSEALAMCLRALGVEESYLPAGLAERTALFRTMSADRRMLVVLDDVTHPAQVRPLVPQGAGSALLATSTWRLGELALDGAALLPLDTLDAEGALHLLGTLGGQRRIDAEPEAAARLAELCGGLPIALRIAAARLHTRQRLTIADLVAELTDEQSRLSHISVSSVHEERTVSAALELAYRDLPAPAAALYRTLGCLPGRSFDAALAAVASDLTSRQVQPLLDTLEAASLLGVAEDGRYRLHDLVRLHALEGARQAEPPDTERQIVTRATGHYLALTALADLTIRVDRLRIVDLADVLGVADVSAAVAQSPFAGADAPAQDAIAWLEAERPNLLATLRAAARYGLDRQTWQLSEVLTVLFLHHRHLADWREVAELGADAAARDGVPAAEARLRSLLSRPLLDLGRDEQAREQLEIAERRAVESGHLALQASVQEFLGRYLDRHDPQRAIAAYRSSLALNIQADEERGAALAGYFLGCAQAAAGDLDTALTALEAARRTFLALHDRRMAARALADLGRVRARQGDRSGAAADLSAAAGELREQRAGHYEAQALEDLADVLDDAEQARDCLSRALEIHQAGGSPRAAELRARLAG
ncbi:ATP-binding protein [Kitasatospora acidiphila]|uniref:ATP-binding protein n=1 Tax=Kitasatospora acidiphila TaxID=2567942 RepID=UPI003C767868